MAGQVKDWVYKKIDWAYNTGSWQWAVDVATTAELFKLFSSTVIFTDAANVYDNKFYGLVSKYDGLMIRPITGSNGYTGVMHFNLYEDDSRYKSDMEGLYGEYTLRDLVLMVFKACGLDVDEAKRTYWINQVMSLMVTMPAERSWVCNTSIRPAGGYQVAAFVDKAIVDDIIDCMHTRGMFDFEYVIAEKLEAVTTYTLTPSMTLEEVINAAYNNFMNNDYISWFEVNGNEGAINHYEFLRSEVSASTIYDDIIDFAENTMHLTDLDDYLINIHLLGDYLLPGRISVYVKFYKLNNDSITTVTEIVRQDMSENPPAYREGEGYRLSINSLVSNSYKENNNIFLTYTINNGNIVKSITNAGTSGNVTAANINSYYVYATNTPTYGQIYEYLSNYGIDMIGPEGVSIITDADKPSKSTTSSNFWPSWAGRAVTVHGYSGSNHPTYTYIPVGYGDYDYEGFTQARVQSGWIYNDNYLQKLGLSMELLPEYEPVEPDPGNDEPIRPDPDPTPDPTPEEEEPLDLSANRLFTVHTLTNAEVNALGGFLYSSTFIEAIKNMFTEPMDAIIGCFILNYGSGGTIPTGSNETLKLGSVLGDSGVTGTRVTNQTFECSFGTVTIGEFYHNVEDYAPYSSAQIFLPYIGFCDLDINEIMNSSITLKYRFDVYTGACLARLFVRKNGVLQELYNFEGNSAVHIPLTGRDFTNSVSSLITGAVGVIGGAATGNPIASVMGAKSLMGSTIPTTRRSGSLSANIGVLGGQKPFILIKRPKAYNAAGYYSYYGYPSNWSVSLGDCSGYTRVKDVHLDALACTDAEREEIETLLREGVIF